MQKYVFGDIVTYEHNGAIKTGIIEYSYKEAYGGNNDKDYSVVELNSHGEVAYSWAWLHESSIISSNTTQRNKMIELVKEYNGKSDNPFTIYPNAMASIVGYRTETPKKNEDYKGCSSKEEYEGLNAYLKKVYTVEGCWRANYGDKYYIVTDDGGYRMAIDRYTLQDQLRYTIGNYFQTLEGAKKAADEMIELFEKWKKNR